MGSSKANHPAASSSKVSSVSSSKPKPKPTPIRNPTPPPPPPRRRTPPPPPPGSGPGPQRPSYLSVALRRRGPPAGSAAGTPAPPRAAAAFDVAPPVAERTDPVVFPASLAEMSGGGGSSSSDDQILLFGSFTEAETKLWQPNANKTRELSEIQFGSLNFSALNLSKESNSITQGAVYPAKLSDGQNKIIITKDIACSNKKETVAPTLPNGKPVLFNGSPTANANVSPNNGVIENNQKAVAAVLTSVPAKNVSSPAPLSVPEVDHDGIERNQNSSLVPEITENGGPAIDTPTTAAPVDELVTSLNKKDFRNKPLLPHGLKNTGNICFLNSSLQALLSCWPFVQLLQNLRNQNIPKAGYPTLNAFIEFISQFDVLDDSNVKKDEKFATIASKSVIPSMFDTVLRNFTPDVPAGTASRPRQEDAQEFLSFAMDRMHDELVKLNGNGSNSKEGMIVSSNDDDAWETVGKKNKSAIMRSQSFVPSELTAIFGGQLQSCVKATGNKASVTVQPFRLIHLDIFPDAVQKLDDALRLFAAPESLEGYRTAAGKAGLVTARKSVKIHSLSKIMILHLKRFSYGSHGCTKLFKPIHFPLELVLSRDLLSSPSSESRRYELVATITHLGANPSRGHYTADAKSASGQWLRFDDDNVTPVSLNKVLHDQAYVLFYKQL
uniref:Ubiquitin carboxyl-terminal hydrolase n=2 Tax=Oryza TaxID=4527 RepID=A0A0E0QCA6_ORYRU